MAFRKTEEEKAARDAERKAEAYASSPVGQAEAAHRRGDGFFQIELEISKIGGLGTYSAFGSSGNAVKHTGGRPDLLGQIEDVGWRLEHVGYVFVETGATTSNRFGGTGQGVVTRGQVMGVYLFRRR